MCNDVISRSRDSILSPALPFDNMLSVAANYKSRDGHVVSVLLLVAFAAFQTFAHRVNSDDEEEGRTPPIPSMIERCGGQKRKKMGTRFQSDMK